MLENKAYLKDHSDQLTFYLFIGTFLAAAGMGIWLQSFWLGLLPFAGLFALSTIIDMRTIYYAFYAIIPFSIEYYVGSLGTNLPSEAIMLVLTGIAIILFLVKMRSIDQRYVLHPISVMIIAHVLWILTSSLFSTNHVLSFKFFVAKLWYVIPFFFLTMYMLRSKIEKRRVFIILNICLAIATTSVLVRHSAYNFSFETYNKVVYPIFRNHVNYAAMLVIVMPFTWALMRTEKNKFMIKFWAFLLVFFTIGIYFSYTRAAQGCIVLAIGAYFIIKYRLTKMVLAGSLIGVIFLSAYMINNNKYLEFAPDFERTITHHSYDNLLDATIKLEDISTMERVYRWVAGGYMVTDRPLVGFGPNGFYNNYHKYSVTSFKTYVSDNPEKSGIHNYYLMIMVEQGFIGLFIFLALLFTILIKGEEIYHQVMDREEKLFVMAATLCIIIISILQLMNDLLESDKIGPFFFISAAIIVTTHLKHRKNISIDEN